MEALEIKFVVHAVRTVPYQTQVSVLGEKVAGTVDCVEVELVTSDETLHGNFTARFIGKDAASARGKLKAGQELTFTAPFSVADEARTRSSRR